MKEALRLYPPLIALMRKVKKPLVYKNYTIPEVYIFKKIIYIIILREIYYVFHLDLLIDYQMFIQILIILTHLDLKEENIQLNRILILLLEVEGKKNNNNSCNVCIFFFKYFILGMDVLEKILVFYKLKLFGPYY